MKHLTSLLIVLLANSQMAQAQTDSARADDAEHEVQALTEPAEDAPRYPAAIQRMLDGHRAEVLGRGTVGDLAFFLMRSGDQRQVFLTSPQGFLIKGKVYRPDGRLLFDTHAEPPIRSRSSAEIEREGAEPDASEDEQRLIRQALDAARGPAGAAAVWQDLGVAAVIEEGAVTAPLIYAFIDPYCPYCHQQWQQLRGAIEHGDYRVRWVPVAVLESSKQDIGTVLGLLDRPDAGHLANWMTRRAITRRDSQMAKLALIRNNTLFKRLQSRRVPTLLYQQADGTIVMKTGVLSFQ